MSATGHEGKRPSTAELQSYMREGQRLCFVCLDGSRHFGSLRWFDDLCFAIALDSGAPFTLQRARVVGYGPDNGA